MESIFDQLRNYGAFEFILIALIYLYHNIAYEDSEHPQKLPKNKLIDSPKQSDLPVYNIDTSIQSQNSADVLSYNKIIRPPANPIPDGNYRSA
jgi:hypothetical protein